MKRVITIFILLFFLGMTGFAQKGKQVELGLGGQFINSWVINQHMYNTPEFDYALKLGYSFSLLAGYSFTENIAVRTEVNFTTQGQKYSGSVDFGDVYAGTEGYTYTGLAFDGNAERDLTLHYMHIPVFFKYAFGSGGGTKFRFMLGPQFSFLSSAEQNWTLDGDNGDQFGTVYRYNTKGEKFFVAAEDVTDRFESFNMGVAIDVGADIFLSDKFYINAGMRFNYSFNDINAAEFQLEKWPEPGKDPEPYKESFNMWGGLSVGINYMIDVEGYKQRNLQ